MCGSATAKRKHVIFDFDMVSRIITFEQKGKYGKEKHQNLDVKVKVVSAKGITGISCVGL